MSGYQVVNQKWLRKTTDNLDLFLSNLNALLLSIDKGIDTDEVVSPVSNQLYCGCDNCVRREILAYCIPVIIEAYKDGLIQEARR